jgi:hypothetical protein
MAAAETELSAHAHRAMALAERLLGDLHASRTRLEELHALAEPLDRLDGQLSVREGALAQRQELIEIEASTVGAQLAELEERELQIAGERSLLDLRASSVSVAESKLEDEAARLVDEAARLDDREEQFAGRWGWLVRSWRLPVGRGGSFRRVDLLFIPTVDGYRLLNQQGLGLENGAILSGLIGEERSYVVTKIAPFPFDDRWCAYLQEYDQAIGGKDQL